MFKPKSINEEQTMMLDITVSRISSISGVYKDVTERLGYKFYVVNQSRGACYYKHKVITIPLWAITGNHNGHKVPKSKQAGYWVWYISHEMAHAYAGWGANHGKEFMMELQRICPPEYIHHELDYKPRNGASAGIDKSLKDTGENIKVINLFDLL